MEQNNISALNERSREIFRHVVDAYVATGDPIGSRTISRLLGTALSPATIRNVMADLEEAGLLFSPHTSAGRLPTDLGLRMFVDGLLEIGGDITEDERSSIEGQCATAGRSVPEMLEEASSTLAGLSECAGLVISPKASAALRHIEFVPLNANRALAVLVNDSGMVENRVIDLPLGLPPSSLVQAGNYLNARLAGNTIEEAQATVNEELVQHRAQLDDLTRRVVEAGLAIWSEGANGGSLILRGQGQLLADVNAIEDLDRIRVLFDTLERKESVLRLLDATGGAEGVQIFIGSENDLFRHTGCSMIIAPYHDTQRRIVGAIGVIGPMRMNYARIIPMVDYTSKLIGNLLNGSSG